jgi:hypothetical protein
MATPEDAGRSWEWLAPAALTLLIVGGLVAIALMMSAAHDFVEGVSLSDRQRERIQAGCERREPDHVRACVQAEISARTGYGMPN